jgi:hypothetical protein
VDIWRRELSINDVPIGESEKDEPIRTRIRVLSDQFADAGHVRPPGVS